MRPEATQSASIRTSHYQPGKVIRGHSRIIRFIRPDSWKKTNAPFALPQHGSADETLESTEYTEGTETGLRSGRTSSSRQHHLWTLAFHSFHRT